MYNVSMFNREFRVPREDNKVRREIEEGIIERENNINFESVSDNADFAFHPKHELQKIKSINDLTEKEQKLNTYKQMLKIQYEGIASMQDELIKYTEDHNNVLNEEEILSIYKKYESKYLFSIKQSTSFNNMLNSALNRNEKINKLKNEFNKPEDLYEYICKIKPKGNVDVVYGPVSLAFICENEDDYNRIYINNFSGTQNTVRDDVDLLGTKRAEKSAGFYTPGGPSHDMAIRKMIIAVKNNKDIDTIKKIINHEQQHALNRLYIDHVGFIRKNLGLGQIYYETDINKVIDIVEKYCIEVINQAGQFAQDEILAYSFDGLHDSEESILKPLLENRENGGLYSYFDPFEIEKDILEKCISFNKDEKNIISNKAMLILGKAYKELLTKSIDIVNDFKNAGYSSGEITALLMSERINKWDKIYKRVVGN